MNENTKYILVLCLCLSFLYFIMDRFFDYLEERNNRR